MRPWLRDLLLTGGWIAGVAAAILYLPGADRPIHYVAGYAFSMFGPLVPAWRISAISDALWTGSGGSHGGRETRLPMAVGFVEDGLYTTAYLMGKSEFIGAWLVLKVAGGWRGWTHGHDGVSGRALSQIFLIGTGLSVAYGVMGALLIDWLGQGSTLATIAAPASLIALHAIVWAWATLGYKPGGVPPSDRGSLEDAGGARLHNPLVRFVWEVAVGALAAAVVFVLFRLGEWAVERADAGLPVSDSGPSDFLRAVLSWGGAFAAAGTWLAVTIRQFGELLRALFGRQTLAEGSEGGES